MSEWTFGFMSQPPKNDALIMACSIPKKMSITMHGQIHGVCMYHMLHPINSNRPWSVPLCHDVCSQWLYKRHPTTGRIGCSMDKSDFFMDARRGSGHGRFMNTLLGACCPWSLHGTCPLVVDIIFDDRAHGNLLSPSHHGQGHEFPPNTTIVHTTMDYSVSSEGVVQGMENLTVCPLVHTMVFHEQLNGQSITLTARHAVVCCMVKPWHRPLTSD